MEISRKQRTLLLATAVLSVATSACNPAKLPFAPKEDIAFAEGYLQKINAEDFDYVSQYLATPAKESFDKATLKGMADLIPDDETEPSLTSFSTSSNGLGDNKSTQITLAFDYAIEEGDLTADIEMLKQGDEITVSYISIRTE